MKLKYLNLYSVSKACYRMRRLDPCSIVVRAAVENVSTAKRLSVILRLLLQCGHIKTGKILGFFEKSEFKLSASCKSKVHNLEINVSDVHFLGVHCKSL